MGVSIESGAPPTKVLRLFCFPYAGGSERIFQPWQKLVPPEIDVCPVCLPGRGRRFGEPINGSVKAVVSAVCDELWPYLGHRFAFFGHSMGAVLAFELSRLLTKRNRPPVYLFVSGRGGPACRTSTLEPIHELPDDAFVAKLRELDGTPEEVLRDPEMMALLLPIVRADFKLAETYTYTADPPLSCPLSAFGGLEDVSVAVEDLRAWQRETLGPFSMRVFSGGHFFINEAFEEVTREVTSALSLLPSP